MWSDSPQRHLAVIPARGGSKRLPRKNIIAFCGRPIISYTIEAAREAGLFARILVSTEDDEIAAVAGRWQAEVDRRPAALASDAATVAGVCLELLDRLEAAGDSYDTLSVLYATAPRRTAADIRATLALIEPGSCDFAMAVTEFERPVHQALELDSEGYAVPAFPDSVNRRADAAGRFAAGNGSTYCVSVAAFRRERTFYGQPLRVHIMPRARSIDIDTVDDLNLALHYHRLANQSSGSI
jgi:CMP-N-acetylneuraminic acid synthetase